METARADCAAPLVTLTGSDVELHPIQPRPGVPALTMPVLLMTGCAAPPASGSIQTLRRAIPAGIGVRVASYVRFNERCEQVELPVAAVTREPPHGVLVARPATVIVGGRRFVGATDCRDKEIGGIELFYTPQAGFRSTDVMEYRVTEEQKTLTFTATVDVR